MRRPLTETAHTLLSDQIETGDFAVDATVGNGHDTLFLARQVGPSGHVLGLDIQEAAIHVTRSRLEQAGLLDRASLVQSGHERLDQVIPEGLRHQIKVVMFNLGYLPGGDHAVTTRAETTVKALSAALAHLREDGILSLMVYRGHAGGNEEYRAILQWIDDRGVPCHLPAGAPEDDHRPVLMHLSRAMGAKEGA